MIMNRNSFITIAALIAIALPAQAQTPGNLSDLIDIRASSGEQELQNRGYFHRNTIKVNESAIAYWWSPQEQRCIAVTTTDGRYESIINQPEALCDDDQTASGEVSASRYDSAEDLVGLRASSGEQELENLGYAHYNTITARDSRLAYWWNPREQRCIVVTTTDGRYESIVDQPEVMCGESQANSSAGFSSYDSPADLVDIRASSGEQELENLGYSLYNTITVSDSRIGYWWNRREQHCIAVTTSDGRYESIIDQPEAVCGEGQASAGSVSAYDSIEDLVGIRASSGEQELENFGYSNYNTITAGESRLAYWWNRREQRCIVVTTQDGRYESIVDQPEVMCGE
jgi:hypothetical protein